MSYCTQTIDLQSLLMSDLMNVVTPILALAFGMKLQSFMYWKLKIALHIEGPGHEIYANFPNKIIHPDFVRSKFSFQLSAYVNLPSNVKWIV